MDVRLVATTFYYVNQDHHDVVIYAYVADELKASIRPVNAVRSRILAELDAKLRMEEMIRMYAAAGVTATIGERRFSTIGRSKRIA